MKPVTLNNWGNGANNRASKDRLPEGFARHAVNVDPLPGGTLAARCGYEQVYVGTDVRGVLSLGNKLLIADADQLVEYDASTDSARVLREIAGAGVFVGAELNQILYFCTENECLQYDGREVTRWGVPDVLRQPELAVGSGLLGAGHYQIVLTYIDAAGREGGTSIPKNIKCAAGDGLLVTLADIPAGLEAVLYVSALNGSTLYEQHRFTAAGSLLISSVRDDTAECVTVLQRSPSPYSHIAAHRGVLLCAAGPTLAITVPMMPHLVDRVSRFFQFPAPIGEVMSNGTTAFVSADKCYAISGAEGSEPSQRTVFELPAFTGTSVELPDGEVAWMTPYGQAISNENGGLILVSEKAFIPAVAERGAAGLLEHNGNQLIVTTTRGCQLGNGLAASDYFIGEILNP